MATINIHDLRPAGSELFQDSESFLNELSDEELDVSGGRRVSISITLTYSLTITRTYSLTWTRTRTF